MELVALVICSVELPGDAWCVCGVLRPWWVDVVCRSTNALPKHARHTQTSTSTTRTYKTKTRPGTTRGFTHFSNDISAMLYVFARCRVILLSRYRLWLFLRGARWWLARCAVVAGTVSFLFWVGVLVDCHQL